MTLNNEEIKTTSTRQLRRLYFYNRELTFLLEENRKLEIGDDRLWNQSLAIKEELINRNEFNMTAEQLELYTRVGKNWAFAEWEDMQNK